MLRFCAVVLFLTLAGCAGAGGAATGQLPAAPALLQAHRHQHAPGLFLYVVNYGQGFGPAVTVYEPGSTALSRVLFIQPYYGGAPTAVAFDSKDNAYVGLGTQGASVIGVFSAGSATLIRTIDTKNGALKSMVFDTSDTLYVANPANFGAPLGQVSVIPSGQTRPSRTIKNGMNHPSLLAFDSHGNLFVANSGNNSVAVFAPAASAPSRVITDGIVSPSAFAFDRGGNLYVANRGTWTGSGFLNPSITVYPPGRTKASRTIVKGVDAPDGLAFDSSGNLYAANDPPFVASPGSVTVYAPKQSVPKRTIVKGIDKPTALGFDSLDNLYVANGKALKVGTVAVFAPGAATPMRTIVTLIYDPIALGFNPQ